MSASTVLPLGVVLMLALIATTFHRRLPPRIATRTLLTTISVVIAAALPTVWLVSLGFVTHVPLLGQGFAWCTDPFGTRHRVPVWAGATALLVSAIGAVRAFGVLRVHRLLRHDRFGGVEIVAHDEAFAYTLPGAGGRVVLSDSLVGLLDPREYAVVVAHESAHARHRHDRVLLVARLGEAMVPAIRPLSNRLRFSLERWADDAAARQCGDRPFVARTLAKVALHGSSPSELLGFTGLGVNARVAALLAPARGAPRRAALALIWVAIALSGALAVLQLHHLSELLAGFCPG